MTEPSPAEAGSTAAPRRPAPEQATHAPWVEIGWVVVSGASADLRAHVVEAALEVESRLRRAFAHYRFRSVIVQRSIPPARGMRELVDLIDLGAIEREAGHWDFACVVADEDLRAYRKPFALGAPASSLNVCVLSVARLRPADDLDGTAREGQALASRIAALFLHLFGHLNDLAHARTPTDYMHPPRGPEDLDRMVRYSDRALAELDHELAKEADPRVEEEPLPRSAFRFYVEACWRNRDDILQAVLKARPWSFVLRLSKLATTAASTLIVLMLTAESWDVGTSQNGPAIAVAGIAAVGLTAAYVLRRQGLLGRVRRRDLTEQRVAANVSVGLIVVLAMLTTYVCLFAISLTLAELVFPRALLLRWVSHGGALGHSDYLVMAGFVATLGVVLGALGASFEGEKYFRHAAIVDEET